MNKKTIRHKTMVQLIHKTENGKIFRCDQCNAIHIEYKNLSFNLSEKQFRHFARSIRELNGEEWEERNKHSYYSRKIIIPTGQKSFNVLLNGKELNEFRNLLNGKTDIKPVFKSISGNNFFYVSSNN